MKHLHPLPPAEAFQRAVSGALDRHRAATLADELGLSTATVRLWAQGEYLPRPSLRARVHAVVDRLDSEWRTEVEAAAKGERSPSGCRIPRDPHADKAGWVRIGDICGAGKRSTWVRLNPGVIELCAGRDGDDEYSVVLEDNPAYASLRGVLSSAVWIAGGCQ